MAEERGIAPAPPHLRHADAGSEQRCGSCKMFDQGVCWGYGNYPVDAGDVCDSWSLAHEPDDDDPTGDNLADGSSSAGNPHPPGLTDGSGTVSSKLQAEGRDLSNERKGRQPVSLQRDQVCAMTAAERRDQALSYSNLQSALYDALCDDGRDVWVVDFGPDWVVWESWDGDADLFQQSFDLVDNAVTLVGDPQPVVMQTVFVADASERVLRWAYSFEWRTKYDADALDALGEDGQAFKSDDGGWSYPIADHEDFEKAKQAVGDHVGDHEVREYITEVADKLGWADEVPGDWGPDPHEASSDEDTQERSEEGASDSEEERVPEPEEETDEAREEEETEEESETSEPVDGEQVASGVLDRAKRYKARHKSTPSPQPEVRVRMTDIEMRAGSGNEVIFEGTPIVYNADYSVYDMVGKFTERMAPTVCDDVLASGCDCRFLFNHDGMPLARTVSGTLELNNSSSGLQSVAHIDTRQNLANDLMIAVERGDVSQMSVGFVVALDEWDSDFMNRTVVRFADMPDVSAVTYPASPTTAIKIAQRMLYGTPIESRARIREAYKLARDVRAGKVLNATNAALIVSALEALHKADDLDLEEMTEHLRNVDQAIDEGVDALSQVSGLPAPDSTSEAEETDDNTEEADEAARKAEELALEKAAAERKRMALEAERQRLRHKHGRKR